MTDNMRRISLYISLFCDTRSRYETDDGENELMAGFPYYVF